MKLLLQTDADLNEDVVTGVIRREPQIDFQTATRAPYPAYQIKPYYRWPRAKTGFSLLTIGELCQSISQTSSFETIDPASSSFPKQISIRAAIDELTLILGSLRPQ